MKRILTIILSSLSLVISACGGGIPGVYKIDVQQGNIITQEDVNKIKIGMSRKQVHYILGTPLIVDSFHKNRWDYVYTFQHGKKKPEEKKISFLFLNEQVTDIKGDLKPIENARQEEKTTEVVSINPKSKKKKGFFSRWFSPSDTESVINKGGSSPKNHDDGHSH